MDTRILVVYATKYGATAEIAEKIGQVLRQAGLSTDVQSLDRVDNLSAYEAVVLGSAVYIGQWRRKAAAFLKANETVLAEQPLWLFSSGPTGEGDPIELTKGWYFPKTLHPIADRVCPQDITLFHGNVNMKNLSFIGKWMMKKVEAPVGDYRNWEAVTSWAGTIADELNKEKK